MYHVHRIHTLHMYYLALFVLCWAPWLGVRWRNSVVSRIKPVVAGWSALIKAIENQTVMGHALLHVAV